MRERAYIPRKGDFITVAFGTPPGHEQHGRRPVLVLSNDLFNRHTGLCVVCPVTSTRRDHPFHVPVPETGRVTGFVMTEQVRSIDFRARQARRVDIAPESVVLEALSLLDACLY